MDPIRMQKQLKEKYLILSFSSGYGNGSSPFFLFAYLSTSVSLPVLLILIWENIMLFFFSFDLFFLTWIFSVRSARPWFGLVWLVVSCLVWRLKIKLFPWVPLTPNNYLLCRKESCREFLVVKMYLMLYRYPKCWDEKCYMAISFGK